MKKKIIVVILALFGLAVIGVSITFFLKVFNYQEAGILIETEPSAVVYINNKEVGKTPYKSNLKPGEVAIRIKPLAINGQTFDDYETKIILESGIETIIKRVFNETDEKSSGAIVSFEKVHGEDGFVTVVSVPDNAQVIIDGKIYGYTPRKVKISSGEHKLVISAEKYLEKSLPIKVIDGYKLTASVKLAKADEPLPTEPPVIKEKIEILDTDTGFLRVREEPRVDSLEITKVKSGEIYEILETNESKDWYKIMVAEMQGWVSGEFAKIVN